jgi:formylglycine-generating enzyme required for sulfatase activity
MKLGLTLKNCSLVVICAFSACVVRAEDEQVVMLLKTFVSEFVAITPGEGKFPASFNMGDDSGSLNVRPAHRVTMTKPFAMAKYEVPQNLYEAVMGTNPSRWKGPRNSVEMMSWDEANDFCDKITKRLVRLKLIPDGERIRLPTEAEWEYCCRAGTETKYSFGDKAQADDDVSPKATLLGAYAWHTGNAAGNDPPVGALKPNAWGLYDCHGYLWEFTSDPWTDNYSQAPESGDVSVKITDETKAFAIRGGSWKDGFEKLKSTSRRRLARDGKDDDIGFRCVKSAAK